MLIWCRVVQLNNSALCPTRHLVELQHHPYNYAAEHVRRDRPGAHLAYKETTGYGLNFYHFLETAHAPV